MNDLKAYQKELLDGLVRQSIPAKIVDEYPSFYGIQIGFQIPVGEIGGQEIFIGGFGDYTSTGGRVHVQDYSGEIENNQIANAYSGGSFFGIRTLLTEVMHLDLSLSFRLTRSTFRNESAFIFGSQSQSEESKFTSLSFGIEPGLAPSINLSGITLGVSASYLFAFPSSLKYEEYPLKYIASSSRYENNDAYLLRNNGDKVLIDWSGLKLGVILSYEF